MIIFNLPPEVLLHILQNLDLRDLHSLQLVSRCFDCLIKNNDVLLYHEEAIRHHFADENMTLEDLCKRYPGGWLDGLSGWRDLCRRSTLLEHNWEGRGDVPTERLYTSTGNDVHRFKLEEEHRFVITTHRNGGLRVTSMEDDTLLFELPVDYVRHYAHCEYGNGYLIFDRLHPHSLEVWRLESSDWDGEPTTSSSYPPDLDQIEAGEDSLSMIDSDYLYPQRGVFRPWALFTPPANPRAYRFVYPTLLVGSEAGQEVYLFDAPSATLAQTIPLPWSNAGDVRILYVELGERHVFVCTLYEVLIIPRDTSLYPDGTRAAVTRVSLSFPTDDPGLRIPQLVKQYASRMIETFGPLKNRAMKEYMVVTPHRRQELTALVPMNGPPQEFYAVHVSEDGRNFAAITWLGIVYLVRDFERVARGTATWSEITLRLDMDIPATNLAFDHDRVVIVTHMGLYIVNWDLTWHNVLSMHARSPEPFPALTMHQLLHFSNPLALRNVSCVKLTRTSIWIDWPQRALQEALGELPEIDMDEPLEFGDFLNEQHPYATRMVCKIDFTPQQIGIIPP